MYLAGFQKGCYLIDPYTTKSCCPQRQIEKEVKEEKQTGGGGKSLNSKTGLLG